MDQEFRDIADALLAAYREGVFPMADPRDGRIGWYDPDPRGVIPLDGFRVPRTLRQRVRSGRFVVTSDRAFGEVIRACAAPRRGQDAESSWIDGRIVRAYEALHAAGHAHSVEAWLKLESGEFELVGGLYGVRVGAAFAGESMFSRPERGGTDASKVCLVHLVAHLRAQGFTLLDTQFWNPHLDQFGCVEISRDEYKERLASACAQSPSWEPFYADASRVLGGAG